MTNHLDWNIQGTVLTPSSPAYEQSIARHAENAILRAAYVVYPQTPADIPEILRVARSHEPPLQVVAKCGGIDLFGASSSDGGIVIDLARINHISFSEDREKVTVGGGALWGQVYAAAEQLGVEVVGGFLSRVGVGGSITSGGYSPLLGRYGLAVDNLVEATVVLADGRIVTCSLDQEPDLFWAIRGAGRHFGVVVEFILKAYPVRGPAQMLFMAYPRTELSSILKAIRTYLSSQSPDSRMMLYFYRTSPGFYPSIALLFRIEASPEKMKAILSPFRTLAQPAFRRSETSPSLSDLADATDAMISANPPRCVSTTVPFSQLWDDVISTVFDDWASFTEAEEHKKSVVLWEFDSSRKMTEIKSDATALPLRDSHYYAVITDSHTSPDCDPRAREWVSRTASTIRKANEEKTGVRLPPLAATMLPGEEDIADVYGANYARLRKLKAKYDPHKVWGKNDTIEPDFE